MDVEINKEAYTTEITVQRSPLDSPGKIEVLLLQDQCGYYIQQIPNIGNARYLRLGRRKSWQKALYDTLVILERWLDEEPRLPATM